MRLVADANVLLSAVTGGRARLVLARADLADVVTTVTALDEVNEYAEPLARRLRLPLGTVLLAVTTLPVTVVDRDEYAASLCEAERRMDGATLTTSIPWPFIPMPRSGPTIGISRVQASSGTRQRDSSRRSSSGTVDVSSRDAGGPTTGS